MPSDNLDRGPASERPAASEYNRDKFWLSEDTLELFISDGTQWLGPIGGAALAEEPTPSAFEVEYDSVSDTLSVTSLEGFDFTPVVTINYAGNGSGQITRPPHFVLDAPNHITVNQAAFFLNGGVLTNLDFFVGPSVAATWDGAVNLF